MLGYENTLYTVNAAFFMRITFSRHFLCVCFFPFSLSVVRYIYANAGIIFTCSAFSLLLLFGNSDVAFILSMDINSSANNTFRIETKKRLNWNLKRAHEPSEM